jgi:hypothetical protein
MKRRQFLIGGAGAATARRTDTPPGVEPSPLRAPAENPGIQHHPHRQLATEKRLDAAAPPVPETIREHNPRLFDFVLKRHWRSGNQHFASGVFGTRFFFDRKTA